MRTIRVYLRDCLLVDLTQPQSGRFLRWSFIALRAERMV